MGRYTIRLLVSGIAWFLIAGIFGKSVPIITRELWIYHLVCALLTANVVGIALQRPIVNWTGWKWLMLPLITILLATFVFGLLLPCSWLLYSLFSGGGGVDGEAFTKLPFLFVFYSMTYFLIFLYPLAMATQYFVRAPWRKLTLPPKTSPS